MLNIMFLLNRLFSENRNNSFSKKTCRRLGGNDKHLNAVRCELRVQRFDSEWVRMPLMHKAGKSLKAAFPLVL